MESRRSSSTQGTKLDEKQDDNTVGVLEPNGLPIESSDLEKATRDDLPPLDPNGQPDPYLVHWDDGETANPRNWKPSYKAFMTFQLGMLAFAGSLGSSIILPAEQSIAEEFNVSREVTVLCISLYVLGFALGPCLWAPLSEVYGRKVSILPAVFVLGLFSIGTATSQNAASVFITRFLSGVFGSAPISNVAAALGDLYEPTARGVAVTFYAVAVCGGPTIGPLVGAACTVSPGLGWRWTEYIEAIWVATVLILALVTMPELYPPVLLKRKAQRLRKETGDDRYWHPHESQKINLENALSKYLSRPARMLVTEPMVTCIAIYASFVYGVLYMTLVMFDIVYREMRQWDLVLSTLPFLGIMIGVIAAVFINLANQPQYSRAVEKNKGRAVPEARLPPMAVGGWLFVIGIFW
jgi:MFS family permease